MKLITKEILKQALAVDPGAAWNEGVVDAASFIMRNGNVHRFQDLVWAKDAVTFRDPGDPWRFITIDETEVMGLEVNVTDDAFTKLNLTTLPDLVKRCLIEKEKAS